LSRIRILYDRSEIAEIIGLISYLADKGQRALSELNISLDKTSYDALKFFRTTELKGLMIGDLFLLIDPFLSVREFTSGIEKIPNLEFCYHLLSETVPIDTIEATKENKTILTEYYSSHDYLKKDFLESVSLIIEKTDLVKSYICHLMKDLSKWLHSYNSDHYNDTLNLFYSDLKKALKEQAPLEVAQDLMGKKFKRVSDYKNFIFLPSYFGFHKCIRYFDEDTLIILKWINDTENKSDSDKLSSFVKVLSDKTRLEILEALSVKPYYGIELSEKFHVSRPTISHHLDQLNSMGLVHIERVKNTKYYTMNTISYKKYIRDLNNFLIK